MKTNRDNVDNVPPEQRPLGVPAAEKARNFRLVCFAMTSAFLVHSMLLVAVPVYALELGASPLLLGVIFSAPFLLPLILAIPAGAVVTRFGGRNPMLMGALALAVGTFSMACFPGLGGLIFAQLIIGLAQLHMVLAAQIVISGLDSGKPLERYFGWYTMWLSGGQVVGPLLIGTLLEIGGNTERLFLVMSVIAMVGALGAGRLAGKARQGMVVERSVTGYRAQGRLLKSNHGVQVSIAVSVVAMYAISVYGSYLPVYLDSLEISAVMMGMLISMRTLSSMLVRPFTSQWISFAGGRERATLVAILLLALGLMFTGLTDNYIVLGALAVMVGLGAGICMPLSIVVMAESVDSRQRSGALGMRLMANRGVNFLAPLVFALSLDFGGFGLAFSAGGAVMLAAGCGLFVFLSRRNRVSHTA